jgi:hypothetical protein
MWKRKPPSDVAQALIGLMDDPTRWTPGVFCVRHAPSDLLIRHTGFFIAAVVGDVSHRFEGRDYRAMDKAWVRLKKRMLKQRQAESAQRLRDALALPADPVALPAAPAETLEQVEARVRQLRAAVLRAA